MPKNLVEPNLTKFEIFRTFLSLGLSSFGGPIAHLGFFNRELVQRRKWLNPSLFSELIALCQFLPGPSSSQVGLSIGFIRGGFSGALAAWIGFTTPSAIILIVFGYLYINFSNFIPFGAIHGLKIFAVAIVANAIWTMAFTFCKNLKCILITIIAASIILLSPSPLIQFLTIFFSGLLGAIIFKVSEETTGYTQINAIKIKFAFVLIIIFFTILFGLPILVSWFGDPIITIVDSFYRAGSLVFGGGHVVLPLLQTEIVSSGTVSDDSFLAGYGAAQAMPGPLFAFAAYLGVVSNSFPNGLLGGLIALLAIYLPSFLLVLGILPFWYKIRNILIIKKAIIGINASVVGILIAAFFSPVLENGILTLHDLIIALIFFYLINFYKIPIWALVSFCAIESWIFYSVF